MKEKRLYTTGEFAKMAGVTIRTIRYYDTKGILKPSHHNDSGHRLYSDKDFVKLKKILALKYLGLSLDEVMSTELNFEKDDMMNSLRLQKNIIKNKINHMKIVLSAIETAEISMQNENDLNWDKTVDIIEILESEKELLQQYIDSSNLNASVKLQDRFSSNKHGWYNWVFKNINLKKRSKVLEIGCGNGALWAKNIENLNEKTNVTLTDVCEDMISDAKTSLKGYHDRFNFQIADPNDIPFKDESFDIVIANHILFYMKDLDVVLKEIHRVLKPGGRFYCSTIDGNHMKELEELMLGFNNNIKISEERLSTKFGLSNGESILNKYFSDVQQYLYEDKLIVNDTKGILEYIYSIPGNILEVIENKKKEFEVYIDKNIQQNGEFHITNSQGLFESIKR
ncbi:MerR family transcriptional regulator [Romboutsia lituseburensis]|uniref:MerR HTH family regulatory protein n=1 Tax=Romboutsia lituseburensis DSM 797 TaxID=1121325 RepID=A0A1G9T0U1_9FIRM|nr:MerR family transcriptional regulator [Romboutsia lituseburensis]CEH35997.1 Methyltransferase domain protein [Romboutsia lituseburensis]SDM41353.1 MerR HTH family regulatory protein [Romboutsia lituseburensis DSM 797]